MKSNNFKAEGPVQQLQVLQRLGENGACRALHFDNFLIEGSALPVAWYSLGQGTNGRARAPKVRLCYQKASELLQEKRKPLAPQKLISADIIFSHVAVTKSRYVCPSRSQACGDRHQGFSAQLRAAPISHLSRERLSSIRKSRYQFIGRRKLQGYWGKWSSTDSKAGCRCSWQLHSPC